MKRELLIICLVLLHSLATFSQTTLKTIRFVSRYTSFPDSARENGHFYDSVLYTAKDHYRDSSVLLFVPPGVRGQSKVDLVFWFHGWNNNIDTANQFYEIERQFVASGRNAVLVLAETARNAPDSYGGKLERQGDFNKLVEDVLHQLKVEKLIEKKATAGSITLGGHSGAFRAIAYILANGEMPVDNVFLFDALYSQVDKFLSWIQQSEQHRFVNWYTNHGGGTDEVSIQMMRQLDQIHRPYKLVEEQNISSDDIRNNRLLFVHSPREHNVIINRPDNLKLLLESTEALQRR